MIVTLYVEKEKRRTRTLFVSHGYTFAQVLAGVKLILAISYRVQQHRVIMANSNPDRV